MCISSSGLKKKHVKIHKKDYPLVGPINPDQNLKPRSHICFKFCKSTVGIKSHLKAHEQELIIM